MNHKKTIQLLYTSDLHGYLLPINYSDNNRTSYGLARVMTAIKTFDRNQSILIDLGDVLQGSPLMYFHQLNRDRYPNPVSILFNHIGYDYFIPGNHDFNYGFDYLTDFISTLNAQTLCQNIECAHGLEFKKGFDIIEKNGIRILIIGVTTQYIPKWENPANIKGMKFLSAFDKSKEIVDRYKAEVDLIVCAYHGGLEKDLETGAEFVKDTGENEGYRIFTEIPEIDVLLTGHQHRTIAYKNQNRVVLQPGANGVNLGVVTITFDAENRLESIEPELKRVGDYQEDPWPKEVLSDLETANQKFLDEIIGEVVEGNLEIKNSNAARLKKHPIVDFINDIQLDATGAMLSSTALANQVSGFKKQIAIRNVLSTYVYSNTLTVVKITGRLLKEYLERCAEYFVLENGKVTANPRFSYPKMEHYNYDMIAGVDYTFDLRKPFGNRLVELLYQGHIIKDEEEFTIALNNYRASGGGDFEMLKDLPIIHEVPFDIAELIIEYIRKHHDLHIKPRNNIKLLY
ncbi:MAG: bifunctional metallophosphatase/5'-nucleotidase [Bacilli bacterium]|nr:bifunctional metallophosphatase/5'-nucleotidase [Bacilli bacterium]MBN2877455.1 bifunctional metallophosphatase/5'-nucleotidase [Bacilli bacterium]